MLLEFWNFCHNAVGVLTFFCQGHFFPLLWDLNLYTSNSYEFFIDGWRVLFSSGTVPRAGGLRCRELLLLWTLFERRNTWKAGIQAGSCTASFQQAERKNFLWFHIMWHCAGREQVNMHICTCLLAHGTIYVCLFCFKNPTLGVQAPLSYS